MVATGGSLLHCLRLLAEHGASDLTVVCALAEAEAPARLEASGLTVRVFTASVDERLDENAGTVPGLGGAGIRHRNVAIRWQRIAAPARLLGEGGLMTGAGDVRCLLRRALRSAAVLGLAAAVLTACANASHPATHHSVAGRLGASPLAAATTTLETFAPYDAHGVLVARTEGRSTGSCFTTSITVPLPGVYRCMAANQILDPCFAPPGAATTPHTVACFDNPWTPGRVVVVPALPAAAPVSRAGNPWALELAGGVRCIASTGTVPSVDGVALTYSCGAGRAAGRLSGASPAATVAYGPETAGPLRTVAVRSEWRGRT